MDTEKWVKVIREDFPSLKSRRNNKPPIYFDNACTTLVPTPVIAAMNEYYNDFPGCNGTRGRHWFTAEVNDRIEGNIHKGIKGARTLIKEFVNARSDKEIIFTQNTSHAINIIALGFKFHPGDIVLLSDKEHNSNLLPWLRLQKQGLIKVVHIESDEDNNYDLDKLKQKLNSQKVALISMAHTSNLTGYTIPAEEIIKLAHANGAKVLLDAAQSISHRTIDVKDLDVDFLAFSIHKICGPRGVGVLYGKHEFLGQAPQEKDDVMGTIEPCFLGGGTVADATYDTYSLLEPPERFEVGIQNYPGQIAAGTAVQYIQKIGIDRINNQISVLNNFLTKELLKNYGNTGWFSILGPRDANQRGGILTFEVRRPNSVGIADDLSDKNNIMIRDGAFCVHSYLNYKYRQGWIRPKLPSEHRMTYRVSLYYYNTIEECQIFLESLDDIFKERSYI